MTKPVITATTLVTEDGVPIDAVHLPGPKDLAIIIAHGFTLSWQHPRVWRIANRFNLAAGVIAFDFRGHGRSGGLSTLGDLEIMDLDVAVAYARELGYQRIAAVGFSMGSSVVLRHAGLIGGVDAVVSISGPGRWYYRGTERMRRVHLAVEHRLGRFVTRHWLKTRISPEGWKLVPVPPAEAATKIAPVPLLIVHGDQDPYFPPEHARQLYLAAREPKELWLIPGMGHAEVASGNDLVDRIAHWLDQAIRPPALTDAALTDAALPDAALPDAALTDAALPANRGDSVRVDGAPYLFLPVQRPIDPKTRTHTTGKKAALGANAPSMALTDHGEWRLSASISSGAASRRSAARLRNVSDDRLSTCFVNGFLTVAQ
jgi:pimeloyl-ACP methyl ester carboxylesterase